MALQWTFIKNDRPVMESPKNGWFGILWIAFVAGVTFAVLRSVF